MEKDKTNLTKEPNQETTMTPGQRLLEEKRAERARLEQERSDMQSREKERLAKLMETKQEEAVSPESNDVEQRARANMEKEKPSLEKLSGPDSEKTGRFSKILESINDYLESINFRAREGSFSLFATLKEAKMGFDVLVEIDSAQQHNLLLPEEARHIRDLLMSEEWAEPKPPENKSGRDKILSQEETGSEIPQTAHDNRTLSQEEIYALFAAMRGKELPSEPEVDAEKARHQR